MVLRVLVLAQLPTEWLEPLHTAGLDVHLAPELAGDDAGHTHELVASRHHGAKLSRITTEAGAERIMTATSPKTTGDLATSHSEFSQVPISRHVAATARFGTDPSSSACDPWGRLILVAPDKFRGTTTASEAPPAMQAGVYATGGKCRMLPMGDGGDDREPNPGDNDGGAW